MKMARAMLITVWATTHDMIAILTALLATIRRWGPMSLIAMRFEDPICAVTTRDSIAARQARLVVCCIV